MPHPGRPAAPRGKPRNLALAAAALAALALLAGAGFVRELVRSRQIDREIRALHEEAERLRARNFEIARLQSSIGSSEFLEREARLKLGLRKDGEQVVVLRKRDALAQGDEAPRSPKGGAGWSNPKKWFMYFADRNAYDAYLSDLAAE